MKQKQILPPPLSHIIQTKSKPSGYLPITKLIQTYRYRKASDFPLLADVCQRKGEFSKLLGPEQEAINQQSVKEYYQQAEQFEENLGNYAATHINATDAAGKLTQEMKTAISGQIPAGENIGKIFGTTQEANTGSVGQAEEVIEAVFTEGNLREKMSLVYNAICEKKFLPLLAKTRTLPENLQDRPDNIYRDRHERIHEPNPDKQRTKIQPDQVVPPLSDREATFAIKDGKLQWVPGMQRIRYPQEGVFMKTAASLQVLAGGGMSGTTHTILRLAEFFCPDSLYNIRLACLGWMIPAHDHTFYEIMTAGKEHDLEYTPGPLGYRQVAPLALEELSGRTKEGYFPDYYLTEEYKDQLAKASKPADVLCTS